MEKTTIDYNMLMAGEDIILGGNLTLKLIETVEEAEDALLEYSLTSTTCNPFLSQFGLNH